MTLKAGTILIDEKNKKIGLVYRKRFNDYSYPKGHLEKNETLLECAIRETTEETGRKCIIKDTKPVKILHYKTEDDGDIDTYMYLSYDNGKEEKESPDPEELVWVDYEKVYDTLTYKDLKELWQEIYPKIK